MGKFVDLTGKTFGNWLVIEYDSDERKWLCECQCEDKTLKLVHSYSLRNGSSTSCGCTRKKILSKSRVINLQGQRFGDWLVIEYAGESMWLCECQCENKTRRLVKAQSLKEGKSTSCGHNTTGFKDLTGHQFGNWVVIRYLGDQKWECQCQCDNKTIKVVDAYNLVHGLSKSCGCNKLHSDKLIDIKGQKFGKLTVLHYLGGNKWLCQCDCGEKSIHYSHNIRRSNNTISCGCNEVHVYSKEEIIDNINGFTDSNNYEPFIDDLCVMLDRSISSVRRYIDKYDLRGMLNKRFNSKAERDIYELFPTNYVNTRNIIDLELDLYYPDSKIAIEFNGSYWHSDIYKNKYYHQQKTIACAKKGIQLIHIFEYEWNNPECKNKIIDILNTKLNKDTINKIYARNTKVKFICEEEASKFLNKYHLQGAVSSSYYLGCYGNNDELLGVMSFGKPRFNKEFEFEILRVCWKSNTIVIGGTEKLFKYFVNKLNPTSVITYSNISKFTGNIYIKIGFNVLNNCITEPNYVWWDYNNNIVLTRYQTQKHKLIEHGLGTEDQTEDEIMYKLGYLKIYDSGNLRLAWYKNN